MVSANGLDLNGIHRKIGHEDCRVYAFFYLFWGGEKQTANIMNAAETPEKYVMCEVK